MTDQKATGNVSDIAAVDGCHFESGKNKAAKRQYGLRLSYALP